MKKKKGALKKQLGIVNVFKLLAMDLKNIFTNPVATIIVIGLCILPSLYAWINIKACWDPYSNTGELPIVVVNKDEGGSFNENYINVGDEVVESLSENKSVGWVIESDWQANDGLNKGKYYALIEIPPNFTKGLISLTTTTPERPTVVYRANEKANAIATKITNVAAESLTREIKSNFISTVNKTAFETLNMAGEYIEKHKPQILDLRNTLEGAMGDLEKTSKYIDSANASSKEFQGYLVSVKNDLPKITQAIENLQKIVGSSKNLVNTSNDWINSISSNINTDMVKVQSAHQKIQPLITSLQIESVKENNLEKVNELTTAISDMLDLMDNRISSDINILTTINNYKDISGVDSTVSTLLDLQSHIESLKTQLSHIVNVDSSMEDINSAVLTDIVNLNNEILNLILNASNNIYVDVIPSLNEISKVLNNSMDTTDGIIESTKAIVPQLNALANFLIATNAMSVEEANNLNGKIESLNSELATINEKTKSFTEETLDKIINIMMKDPEQVASFLSSPVDLVEEEVYNSGIFGVGLTPFYSVLAIWVGVLLACCLLAVEYEEHIVEREKLTHCQEHFAKLLLFLLIAIVQSLIIVTGDIFILGVKPDDIPLLFGFTIATAVTFTVIIFTLVSMFGNVGKAIAVIMMVFQIAGSGGIYPIETNPKIFGVLEPLWPFTYAINGFREAISGPVWDHVKNYFFALGIFIVIFMLLAIVKNPVHKIASKLDNKFKESGL